MLWLEEGDALATWQCRWNSPAVARWVEAAHLASDMGLISLRLCMVFADLLCTVILGAASVHDSIA